MTNVIGRLQLPTTKLVKFQIYFIQPKHPPHVTRPGIFTPTDSHIAPESFSFPGGLLLNQTKLQKQSSVKCSQFVMWPKRGQLGVL